MLHRLMLTLRLGRRFMQISTIFRAIICAGLLSLGLQANSTIIVGNPSTANTGSCDPFGCASFFDLGTYQQVYTSAAFASPEEITQLVFPDTQVQNAGQGDKGT